MNKNKAKVLLALGLSLCLVGCAAQKTTAAETTAAESSVETTVETTTVPETAAETTGQKEREKFPAFTAMDLNGNTVTDAIFAANKLTVVNNWATFCDSCINEMPELGKWGKELPEGVQLVGIVWDVYAEDAGGVYEAQQLVAQTGADYIQIIPSSDLNTFSERITTVPVTMFVDSEGYIVGEPIVGAYVSEYKLFVKQYLNQHP